MLSWARHGPPPAPLPPIDGAVVGGDAMGETSRAHAQPLPPALSKLIQQLRPLLNGGKLDRVLEVVRGDRGTTMGLTLDRQLRDATADAVVAADAIGDVFFTVFTDGKAVEHQLQQQQQQQPQMQDQTASSMNVGPPTPVIKGTTANGYFGQGLCTGDVDGDGQSVSH